MEAIYPCFDKAKSILANEDKHVTRIIFTRHGRTILNAKQIFQPWTPEGDYLNEEGYASAVRLGKKLFDTPIKKIYSSDWHRAIHTAQLINEELQPPLNEITISRKLRDFNFGVLSGVPVASLNYLNPDLADFRKKKRYLFEAPGGDIFKDFYVHKKEALQEILQNNNTGNILIVSHNYVTACLLIASLDLSPEEYANININNTSISVVEFEKHKIPGKLLVFNEATL